MDDTRSITSMFSLVLLFSDTGVRSIQGHLRLFWLVGYLFIYSFLLVG